MLTRNNASGGVGGVPASLLTAGVIGEHNSEFRDYQGQTGDVTSNN